MEPTLAFAKTLKLMIQHGLDDWTLTFDRKKKCFGVCSPMTKTITLSLPLVKLNNEEEVMDTAKHEIAHALDWIRNRKAGHDYSWKAICVEIGARPEQYFTEKTVVVEDPKYILRNTYNGALAGKYYRLPTKGFNPNQYNLYDGATGAIIKPTHVLKNFITGKLIEKYYSLPTKIRDRQQFLSEYGRPSTKGQLKLYKVA